MKKTIAFIVLVLIVVNAFVLYYFDLSTTGRSIFGGWNYERENVFVGKVIDGDTVIINGESVRLLGIDTPERGEPCYKEAKKHLEEIVLNKMVTVERGREDRDRYKRLLRYIFIETNDGELAVNLKMISDGFAIARFYDDVPYKKEYVAAEQYARENNIGCKWQMN